MTAFICFGCSKYIRINGKKSELDLSHILRKESVSNHMQSNGTNLIQNREWHKYKITLWYFIIYNIAPCSKVFRVQRIFFAKSLSYQICKLVCVPICARFWPSMFMFNSEHVQLRQYADKCPRWLMADLLANVAVNVKDARQWLARPRPASPASRQPGYRHLTCHNVTWECDGRQPSSTHSSAILASTFESD